MTEDHATPDAGPQPAAPRPVRSRRHKVIGGVCGGLGRYFDVDPVLFRVPLAVLSVVGGLGFIGYGVAWLILPFEGEEENEGRRLLSGRVEGPGLTALLFTVAGCGLFLASLGTPGGAAWFSVMVLAALAGGAYWSRHRSRTQEASAQGGPVDPATAQAVAEAPPEAQAPPAPPLPSWWREPSPASGRTGDYLWGPADARPAPETADGGKETARGRPERPRPFPGPTPFVRPVEQAPEEPREFPLGALVLLLAALACLTGTTLTWGNLPLGTSLAVGLSAAVAVFGAGLLVSSVAGRLGGGTVLVAVATALLLSGAAVLPENITTTWSAPVWRPAAPSEVRGSYEMGSGDGELDLSTLDLSAPVRGGRAGEGHLVSTEVTAGAGNLTIVVPHDARVTIRTGIACGVFTYSAGQEEGAPGGRSDQPQHMWGGVRQWRSARYEPLPGVEPVGRVVLNVGMGIGHVGLKRAAPDTPPAAAGAAGAPDVPDTPGALSAAGMPGPVSGGSARGGRAVDRRRGEQS